MKVLLSYHDGHVMLKCIAKCARRPSLAGEQHALTHKHRALPRLAVKTGGVFFNVRAGEPLKFMWLDCLAVFFFRPSLLEETRGASQQGHEQRMILLLHQGLSISCSLLKAPLIPTPLTTEIFFSLPATKQKSPIYFNETFNISGDKLNKDIN